MWHVAASHGDRHGEWDTRSGKQVKRSQKSDTLSIRIGEDEIVARESDSSVKQLPAQGNARKRPVRGPKQSTKTLHTA